MVLYRCLSLLVLYEQSSISTRLVIQGLSATNMTSYETLCKSLALTEYSK